MKIETKKIQVQYSGNRPVGSYIFHIGVEVAVAMVENTYEDRETLKALPAETYGSWHLEYDRETIEAQIRKQIKQQVEDTLAEKGIMVDLKVGGGALLAFPMDLDAKS